jgi:hypothetical protein
VVVALELRRRQAFRQSIVELDEQIVSAARTEGGIGPDALEALSLDPNARRDRAKEVVRGSTFWQRQI